MQLHGLEGVLATLKSLPAEVVSKRGGPVKLSLAKGARYLRDREREKLRAVVSGSDDSTGLLEKSIIASRGKAPAVGKGERYLVRIKRKPYDGGGLKKRERVGKRVTTLKTAHLLEYGSAHQPATPFIRPTFTAHAGQTIRIIEADLPKRIDAIVKKLAAANKSKG